VTRASFAGGRPLCTQILPGWVAPQQLFFAPEKRDTGLPDSEDRIPVFFRFNTIPECDGQTDGQTDRQTDGFVVTYTALAKLALRSAVKTD